MGNRPFMPGSNLYGPSESIWGNVPVDQIFAFQDRSCGFGFHDDFIRFGNTSLYDGYIRMVTASCAVQQIDSEANHPGIVQLYGVGDTLDDECVLQAGNGLDDGPFKLADHGLAFEGYIRASAITAAKWSWFLGLATGGAAGAGITDLLFDDAEALYATNDFIGFQHLLAEGAALDGMYQASGQTKVDGAVNTDLDTIHTLVATEWVKLGLLYTPYPRRLGWHVNGVEVAHIGQAALDAAAFPDATFLQPTFGMKDGAGNEALNLDKDWWRVAQITCW